jgi:hypothetical protein
MRIMKNLVLSVTLAAAAFVAHPVPPVHAAT